MASIVTPLELPRSGETGVSLSGERHVTLTCCAERVAAYWRSLGLADDVRLAAAARQLLERIEAQQPEASPQALRRQALREAAAMVERWIEAAISALARRQGDNSCRAVLRCQLRPWLAGHPETFLRDHFTFADPALRTDLRISPEPSPAAMPTQQLGRGASHYRRSRITSRLEQTSLP